MISPETKNDIFELSSKPVGLGGWLGIPYEESGCLNFLVMVYQRMGIEVTQESVKEARHFRKVSSPQFGDIVVFHGPPIINGFHVAMMLDQRLAIQSVPSTGGVGKIDINRQPWINMIRAFYRHESCC